MKNNKKLPQKYINTLSNIVLWTHPTDPWCNMLQTLERRRKYIGVILSDEDTQKYRHENRTRIIMREKRPNTELFLVRIWTLFTQCEIRMKWNDNGIRKWFFVGSNPSVAKMLLRPWQLLILIWNQTRFDLIICMKHVERAFQQSPGSLREKCPNTEFFSVRYFSGLGQNTEIYSLTLLIQQVLENTDQKKLRVSTVSRHWIFRTSMIIRILNH